MYQPNLKKCPKCNEVHCKIEDLGIQVHNVCDENDVIIDSYPAYTLKVEACCDCVGPAPLCGRSEIDEMLALAFPNFDNHHDAFMRQFERQWNENVEKRLVEEFPELT